MMKKYLGIDIGGTNVKFGVVNKKGKLTNVRKISTNELLRKPKPIEKLSNVIANYLQLHPSIKSVGIGIPGTLSKNNKTIISLNNIPALNGVDIIHELEKIFESISFFATNDANAAALGQYVFGEKTNENFFFITLGTGVGGGLILNGELYKGKNGNAAEIHNIPNKSEKSIEFYLGKKGWIRTAKKLYKKHELTPPKTIDLYSPKDFMKAAKNGDPIALELFKFQGKRLGELIVTGVRFFDFRYIYIGGGVSSCLHLLEKSMYKTLKKYLDQYYLKELKIEKSSLKNHAGILGAAALCI